MNITVLVKYVPDTEAIVKVESESELEIENKYFTSFFDEVAIEEAVKLKEKLGGKVTVVTVDNKRIDALRRGIAMGADDAVQITDPALDGSDPFGIARVLAAFLKTEPYDLILCGRQAMDDDAGIVGPAVAELLDIPHVSSVLGLEIARDSKSARVSRQIEAGKEHLTCPLPAVLTAQKGLNVPRIPQVTGMMKAMKAEVRKVDLVTLRVNPSEVGEAGRKIKILKYEPPPQRSAAKMIEEDFPENVKQLVRLLKEEAKVL
ncbi:MAG: electron transfer flavoprotein subunit beta [Proteobacteria bacterium]|nr:electron transfer flavoprotein subunit beta [Pseudomonadota bacterium]